MDSSITTYIQSQPADWQKTLSTIHAAILKGDKSVTATVETMMRAEMIIYKCKGMMKYGLAGGKNYMSLHVLPMYGSKTLYEKFKALLPLAAFQKGCINFKSQDEMPVKAITQIISDCAPIDLVKLREEYLKAKKKKGK